MPKLWPSRKKTVVEVPTLDWPGIENAPAQSCANCGFLRKRVFRTNGNDYQDDVEVEIGERRLGFRQHWEVLRDLWYATPRCRSRTLDLEAEARVLSKYKSETDPDATMEVIRRDRSKQSEFYCPGFHPWIPHYSFEQHWQERQMFRLEEQRRAYERDDLVRDRRIQWFIVVAAFLTILVNVVLTNCGNQESTFRVDSPVPVVVTTPSQESP